MLARPAQAFDGTPWHVSTGNLSVGYIQASPVGAYPRTNVYEAPPSIESQKRLKEMGLVANEDYVAWGAVEREPGVWNWKQHDDMEHALHAAGLRYVVYDWVHFPPTWLRTNGNRTLMRCLEHGQECNYLSIFDPQTIAWYDHFYKNLAAHFTNRIDDVYACILGPYGEGNYPLMVPDWVNMGHCHEGYWCGDKHAQVAFQSAIRKKYSRVARLNRAWGTKFKSFEEIPMPAELANEKFKPSLSAFPTVQDKRHWLDFMTWYHQAIIDFTERSVQTALKYFPASKVRLKPGGNARGVNPIAWGTYCPGYAKMAKPYHIVLQPADCGGAVFGDKWMGTAYQFYGVTECTEPAGGLDDNTFVRRMFSDASSGARQLFTYEFENHNASTQKYVHLFTGKPGETQVAVYCPTTLYRFGESLDPTVQSGYPLRDLCEFDVLDEVLIDDGALDANRYKALLIFQTDIVDQNILDALDKFLRKGGKICIVGSGEIKNVEGKQWMPKHGTIIRTVPLNKDRAWLAQLSAQLAGLKGVDGKLDGLWTCRRGNELFVYNSGNKLVEAHLDNITARIEPHTIWEKR
ncbi:MAG: family 14 glycosylhydrolase [Limisphaerales bacterium]